jgi:hypothetical protein
MDSEQKHEIYYLSLETNQATKESSCSLIFCRLLLPFSSFSLASGVESTIKNNIYSQFNRMMRRWKH